MSYKYERCTVFLLDGGSFKNLEYPLVTMFCDIAFYPNNEGNRFLCNTGTCPPNNTVAYPRFQAIETVHLRAAFL
jgi:hypothetical protein